MSKMKKCAYCGKEGKTTKDHVVAKAFYDTLKVINAITVPACAPCNNGKSDAERYTAITLCLASGIPLTEDQEGDSPISRVSSEKKCLVTPNEYGNQLYLTKK